MKKRKRDIISFVIILLLMALVLLGTQYAGKNSGKEKARIDLWLLTEWNQ